MADFKLLTDYQTYEDPVLIIHEAVEGRTSKLVKDLLMNELKVSVVESTFQNGMHHQNTRTLFEELAGVTNQSFDNLFNGTFDDLMVSMRESLDRQTEHVQQMIKNQTRNMRQSNY